MKYISVRQEDFDKLKSSVLEERSIAGKSIEDYRFGLTQTDFISFSGERL